MEAHPDAAGNEEIRILHLTDPHLFADAGGELRGVRTQASLQSVLNHYATGDWRAERAIVTGDLIQDDSAAAYERFRDLLLPLNMPTHCVPGNHDSRQLMEGVCSAPPFLYCASEEIGNWLIVGLDSCVTGEAGGHVAPEELERLTKTVAGSDARHVMVFLHHPPLPMGSVWLDAVGMENSAEFLEHIVSLDRVRLVVFGHVHQPFDNDHRGVRIIATPSTCGQFLPGSDDFAVDSRPPAYRRITLSGDGNYATDIVWVDEA